MSYLIRFFQKKPHRVAHYVHTINGIEGALCSQIPEPAVGTQSQQGEWVLLESLPPPSTYLPNLPEGQAQVG